MRVLDTRYSKLSVWFASIICIKTLFEASIAIFKCNRLIGLANWVGAVVLNVTMLRFVGMMHLVVEIVCSFCPNVHALPQGVVTGR